MKKITFFIIAVIAFVFNSCSPSVEGETKNWDRNINQLLKLKTDLPAYEGLINKKILEAETIFKSAENISDEDVRAKKMRKANNILSYGCIDNLKNMSSKIDDLNKKKREIEKIIKNKNNSKNDVIYIMTLVENCKNAVKKAEKILNKETEDLDSNPCKKIERAFKGLETTYTETNNAISDLKKAHKEIEEKEKKKEEVAKDIKCEYCGTKNKSTAVKCKSCGANL